VLGNNGATTGIASFTNAVVLGIPGTSNGSIALASSTASGLYTIQPPANAATPTLTLPTTTAVFTVSVAGDGTVHSSTGCTTTAAGLCTLALANAAADTVLANSTTSAAAPTYVTALSLGNPGTTAGSIQLNSSTSSTTGYKLSDASGLQTLGTNENLILAPNGTGYVQINQAGTSAAPSFVLTDATTGWFRNNTNAWTWSSNGVGELQLRSLGLEITDSNYYGWGSGTPSTAVDTTLCRNAAGIVEIGSGTSCNTVGSLILGGVISEGTAFSASGCSNSTHTGGSTAGSFHSGTSGTCTVTVTMGNSLTAPNGWACSVWDTTTTTDIITETTFTTTTAVFSGTTVSGDVIIFACHGF
jgi:hypothetical protein